MSKFERLEWLIGKNNLDILADKKVLVVGCGGVGGYVIEALVRSGIGHLVIVDYDVVSISNCNRQIIALDSTIGCKKVDCFAKRIYDINNTCQLTCYDVKLDDNNIETIIDDSIDFVVDACDDSDAKLALISYCSKKSIPIISSMGTGNRMDPSKLYITTLDKTMNDPLARVMRQKIRKAGIKNKVVVCTSLEIPVKLENRIGSCSFVPASAGLLIASYVIGNIKKEN